MNTGKISKGCRIPDIDNVNSNVNSNEKSREKSRENDDDEYVNLRAQPKESDVSEYFSNDKYNDDNKITRRERSITNDGMSSYTDVSSKSVRDIIDEIKKLLPQNIKLIDYQQSTETRKIHIKIEVDFKELKGLNSQLLQVESNYNMRFDINIKNAI